MRKRLTNLSFNGRTQIRIYDESIKMEYIDFIYKLDDEFGIKTEDSFESGMGDYFAINLADNEHLSDVQWDSFMLFLQENCSEFKIIYNNQDF